VSTSFDSVVERLGLKETEYAGSRELMKWVHDHHEDRYVPEWLIGKLDSSDTYGDWEYWNTFLGRRVEYNPVLNRFRIIGGQVTVTA
jgi:hypothetical protein